MMRHRGQRRDHVEGVRAQWAEQRPDLDTAPIAVVARIGRARAYLDHGLETLLETHGLSRPAWDVLASLRRAGPPYRLTPTQLYRGLMRTSGAITSRMERLERAGLVERVGDPEDGRSVLVGLTARGLELVDRVAPLHLANECRLIAALTSAEQRQLAGLLEKLLLSFELAGPPPPRRSRGGTASPETTMER